MSKKVVVTSDVIVEKGDKILLEIRGVEPFKGMFCLPGGKHEKNEKIEETAIREVKEETSLDVELTDILGVYSDVKRDPRFHSISVVFIAKVKSGTAKAGSDAVDVKWIKIKDVDFNKLAFDHAKIINDYIKWCSKRGTYWSSR